MGYWLQNEEGHSFADADSGEDMVWGDQPADIVDRAIWEIKAVFVKDIGRLPTKKELMAGLTFSTRCAVDELPETVAEAQATGDKILGEDWNDHSQWPQMVSDRGKAYERDYYTATDGQMYTANGVALDTVAEMSRRQIIVDAQQRVRQVVESLEPERPE